MTQLTVNGNTYSDDGTAAKDMNSGGFRDHFIPMVKDAVAEFNADVLAAQAARDAAQASAASAVGAPGTNATSITADTIALGATNVTLTVAGKLFSIGQTVVIASTASPQNWMAGTLTAFNSATGAMTVDVLNISGAGTFSAWTVSLSGPAGVTGVLNELKGANLASAATVNIGAATGNLVHITGVTTITALTLASGAERTVVFDGVLTLTNGANLILPGGANIKTVAGDVAVFRGDGAAVRCIDYARADGTPAAYKNGHLPTAAVPIAAATLDCSTGDYFTKTVAADTAFLFTNVPAGVYQCTIDVDHTAGLISFPAGVKPANKVAIALASGNSHLFMLTTRDQGANWRLVVAPNF